jgi:2-C-methyl-D-erythritol 4-phosphate cytidylyltransferase
MRLPRTLIGVALALAMAAAVEEESSECSRMKTTRLKKWLRRRGLECKDCATKADFVAVCEANLDAPELPDRSAEHERQIPQFFQRGSWKKVHAASSRAAARDSRATRCPV